METMSALEVSTAKLLQDAYRTAMFEKNGKPFSLSDRYKAVQSWQQAAKNCIALRADPKVFVQAQFKSAHTARICYPQSLSGEWAIRNYELYVRANNLKHITDAAGSADGVVPNVSSLVADDLVSQQVELLKNLLVQMHGHVNIRSADARNILVIPAYTFDDWFRVCLFPNDQIIWESYGKEAYESLTRNAEIREACIRRGWDVEVVTSTRRQMDNSPWEKQNIKNPHRDEYIAPKE